MSEDRRKRIQTTIRMAAQMVAKGDPDTRLVGKVRITRLDKDGNPVGNPVECGPALFTSRAFR